MTAAKLADDAVVTANIVDSNVTTAKIADNAVTNGKLDLTGSGDITFGSTDGNQVLDIASHDEVDGGLKLAGTLVTSSAREVNFLDDADSIHALEDVSHSATQASTTGGLNSWQFLDFTSSVTTGDILTKVQVEFKTGANTTYYRFRAL